MTCAEVLEIARNIIYCFFTVFATTYNGDFVLRIMQDATLARQPGERASLNLRGRGNEETGFWHCDRHCDIQQHIENAE